MTALQKLLLQAAHGPAEKARDAWAVWRKTVIWEDIDKESYYLLPALYRALERLEIADEWRPRLGGIYRKTWAANHLLRQTVAPVAQALTDAGAPLILLAAPALVYVYQNDCGLRPLNGIHCLAHSACRANIEQILCDSGWRAQEPSLTRLRRFLRGPAPASVYVAGNGSRLMLWRRLGKLSLETVSEFQANATKAAWPNAAIHVIAPADALRQIAGPTNYGHQLQREGDTLAIESALRESRGPSGG